MFKQEEKIISLAAYACSLEWEGVGDLPLPPPGAPLPRGAKPPYL